MTKQMHLVIDKSYIHFSFWFILCKVDLYNFKVNFTVLSFGIHTSALPL
ncbi:hypothetical protein BAME_39620 [Bacillus sp. M 2-6]|nr:hypothetical protein BAME_39620 [Bacillus sp. M 2-6]